MDGKVGQCGLPLRSLIVAYTQISCKTCVFYCGVILIHVEYYMARLCMFSPNMVTEWPQQQRTVSLSV